MIFICCIFYFTVLALTKYYIAGMKNLILTVIKFDIRIKIFFFSSNAFHSKMALKHFLQKGKKRRYYYFANKHS